MLSDFDDQLRAAAYERVEIRDHARKIVKNKFVGAVTELEQRVDIYLHTSHGPVGFHAPLPDGREVSGRAYDHVEQAVRWCIRDAFRLEWVPVISAGVHTALIRRPGPGGSPTMRPAEAAQLLRAGAALPEWVPAVAGLEAERFFLARRPSGAWCRLDWEHHERETLSWARMRWARPYSGPTLESGVVVPAPQSGFRVDNDDDVLVPYTEARWAEVSGLAAKLQWLHVHVAALFAGDDSGQKMLAGRLLADLPIFPTGPLLGGPTDGES